MSCATDDSGVFHVDVSNVTSSLKFGFDRNGQLIIRVIADVTQVVLPPSEAKALRIWLQEHEKEG